MLEERILGRTGLVVTRLGIGLAAVGRPGYITLGRDKDLPANRSPAVLYARTAEILDEATRAGVRYIDVARSYGRGEEFLGRWITERAVPLRTLTVGSKWGYAYTAGWQVDAAVHEAKELSTERFSMQLPESLRLLGDRLDIYQIHSATAESGCLVDSRLLAALVDGRRRGAYRAVGFTLSGPASAAALEQGLSARIDGERVFDVVQATFNVLEPSLADGLRAAHESGVGVIAKEVFANGRLTGANRRPADASLLERLRAIVPGTQLDRVALGFVLAHPFVDVALSGAATVAQLRSHLSSGDPPLTPSAVDELRASAEPVADYWATRATLPWT